MPFCMCVVRVLVQYLVFIGLVPYIDLDKYFYFSARIFTSAKKTIAFYSFHFCGHFGLVFVFNI